MNIPDIPIPDDMLPKSLSAPQTGYTVLKPFLQQQGREPDRVLGDGNCLFRALSRALTGVEDHHIDLRRTIVEFEASNTAIFEAAHNAINSTKTRPAIPFADYIRNMKKVGVWGTNLEIIAAAYLFQIEIYLATETYHIGDPQWLVYPPKPVSVLSSKNLQEHLADKVTLTKHWIELVHISNSHFDSIKSLLGKKLSPPKLSPPTDMLNDHVIIY